MLIILKNSNMKTTRTIKQLMEFNNAASGYLKKIDLKKQAGEEVDTKLSVSIRSVFKQLKHVFEEHNESINDAQLDNCSVDEKGIILRDEMGALRFTVDGTKKFNAATKQLMNKEVDVHIRIRPENDALIHTLTPMEISAFSGIVITEQPEEDAEESEEG